MAAAKTQGTSGYPGAVGTQSRMYQNLSAQYQPQVLRQQKSQSQTKTSGSGAQKFAKTKEVVIGSFDGEFINGAYIQNNKLDQSGDVESLYTQGAASSYAAHGHQR